MTLAFRPETVRTGSKGLLTMSYHYLVLLAGVFVVANVTLAIAVGRFIRFGMTEDTAEAPAPVKVRHTLGTARAAVLTARLARR